MPMLLEQSDLPADPTADPCVACGKPSECGFWAGRICYPCLGEWRRVAPRGNEIREKYGSEDDSERIYTEFSKRWVEARRKGAA